MAVNILNLFKDQIGDQLAQAASGFLGESEQTTKGLLGDIAPTILGSLIQKGSSESGAASILNMLNQDNYDTNILGDLAGLVTGGNDKLNSFMNIGLPLVRNLLGDKLGSIVDFISQKNSAKSSSVSSLFSLAAPFIMGLIGKKVKGDNMNVGGLMNLLKGNIDGVKSALPAGLLGLANFSNFGSNEPIRTAANTTAGTNPPAGDGGGMGKWLPWLLLLAAFAILWWAFGRNGCNKDKMDNVVTQTEMEVDTMMNNVSDGVSGAVTEVKGKLNEFGEWVRDLGNPFTVTLKDGKTLQVSENSMERRLVDFINSGEQDEEVLKNTWFSFDRLYFETGSSNLTADSRTQLENIAAILKAYTSVNIKMGGYTDASGDDAMNQKLSESRANTAKEELQKIGISGNRIESEGYGEQHPVCPANDTDECKAQNRRIDVRVTRM